MSCLSGAPNIVEAGQRIAAIPTYVRRYLAEIDWLYKMNEACLLKLEERISCARGVRSSRRTLARSHCPQIACLGLTALIPAY